ncbi:sulfotransferase family 2 domain-containing protein [Paraglaciecola sp. MB-3u-78]|uniref:sulfotransferase family 2 domain-containing protein n=1 Tax=Paraglaciecola sp. MB-3u-78 TaxID=2058332 RepID=UPI000C32E02B|nr:sulfotransferase family 2 domain-containing protein [Paraglaciecola sp. MB-3u-78]PKG98755.1 hypothetical protein CXF95_12905 [Paraglaciecola sp. MB-3u-78]
MEPNWKYKRPINVILSRIKAFPFLLRAIVWMIWLLRFVFRRFRNPSPDNATGVMVNDELKLLYIANPKVASSTIKSLFLNSIPNSEFLLTTSYTQFAKQYSDKYGYCKFSFVRDPVERLYSCWQDKISNNKRFADIFIITRFKGLYPDMPFESFVKWLCSDNGKDECADRHWKSQSKLLSSGNPTFDDAKFYNLNKLSEIVTDYAQTNNLSITQNLWRNRLGGDSKGIEAISKDTLQLIFLRYEKDYEAFGPLFKTSRSVLGG